LYVPKRKKNYYKFWWDEQLSSVKEKSIESNKIWKEAARPRNGPMFETHAKNAERDRPT